MTRIEKVRASREGHTFHDTWTARVALELLVPTTTLAAIAVEGFSTEDSVVATAPATEVADLVRYRSAVNLAKATQVEVIQFKYSVTDKHQPMRAGDVVKTLTKFARTDNDFSAQIGRERVGDVVRYELVTNRPFHPSLLMALKGIRQNLSLTGDPAGQADTIREGCNLSGEALVGFLDRLSLSGQGLGVSEIRESVRRTIANWGAATDTLSKLRLAKLLHLCHEKAGATGQDNNLIDRVAVLGALEIAHENELYPTPDAFPSVGETLERPILDSIVKMILEPGPPILVHSPGGMGKTVLMQALARRLGDNLNAIVLFDCFGAGRWRDPADGRHMVQRALPHIANLLAGRGLCDVLLPGASTVDLARAFRDRLAQAVEAVRSVSASSHVLIILDGIDHSALQADETQSDAFSHVLLKSLEISPIDGVTIVASCRTERRDLAKGGAECREIGIGPFSSDESFKLVRLRDETATYVEGAALHSRSGGNPRVLEALLRAGRPYDDAGPLPNQTSSSGDLLDELLRRKIYDARREAVARGLSQIEVDTLLAGLALLPPPVPFVELAAAHDTPEATIESLATDLFPLIDRTTHGLIFRDEPTETLIRRLFRNDETRQKDIIERLKGRQIESNYAARALPVVLTSLKRTDDLIALAFDPRLPASATSRVAQRAIRIARLAAAVVACGEEKRNDDLTQLLLEAARVAGGHERSDKFLREHPDLVAISGDPEAVRRLFEVKTGWPGARHAALAVVHVLSDEREEARRNASRALAWFNWRVQQREEPHRLRSRSGLDELEIFGPAYVEVLAGNVTRVAVWLDKWPVNFAYRIYSRLLKLLAHHAEASSAGRALRNHTISAALGCRSKSRALPAVLLQHKELSPDEARRVIRRLASISPSSEPVPAEFDYNRRDSGLADALVTAAIRAVRLGQDDEARKILAGIGIQRLRLADFRSHWPNTNEIVRFLLAGAVHAVLEKRTPFLIDVAPEEIHTKIRLRKRRLSSEEYEAAVKRLLADPRHSTPNERKRRNPARTFRERDEAIRVLDHRVRPLLPFVGVTAQLLRSENSESIVTEALDRLTKIVSSTSNYPYQDGPQYIAKVAFGILLKTMDTLDALSASNSSRLVDWLINSPIQNYNLWIEVVSILSSRHETQGAALSLADRTDRLIRTETNIGERISANGALARAVWQTSREEAKTYFRKGLEVADAVGSDDYDKASALIEFATNYNGMPLRSETVHAFARICELNIYDEDKFPWTSFGDALARLAGPQAIAIVARLADREKASLSFSLPPLLTSLLRHNRLDAHLAAGLIGLDEPVETWLWQLADFADQALPTMSANARERTMNFVLQEVDRQYHGTAPRETANRLLELCRAQLSPQSSNLRQFEALVDSLETPDPSTPETNKDGAQPISGTELWEEQAASTVDPFHSAAIDAALASDHPEAVGRWSVRFLSKVQERVQNVDDRLRFLQAVSEAKLPSLADKLLALERHIMVWKKQSTAIADAMPRLALELSVRHAEELVGLEWESSYALHKLIELSDYRAVDIISSVIKTLHWRATDVNGRAWMEFACATARSANADAIRSALERYISQSLLDLPEEIGDGAWRADFAAPADPVELVAGILWLRLGGPVAADRWRAAHALRRLADLGRLDVIQALTAKIASADAGPFQDGRLPFFFLHARLWLLISLARIAKDHPASILRFRSLLEAIAFKNSEPHVGMQHFAAKALLEVLPAKEKALRARLRRVNISPFPPKTIEKPRRDFYHSRSGSEAEPENPFYFDYDFSKSEIDGLASVFGSDYVDVVGLTTAWLRRWSKDIKNMWECPRSPNSGLRYWMGGTPARDTWGGHLAWHALLLVAGDLLRKRPVVVTPYDSDPWREWLEHCTLSRKDGFWLADLTDFFPAKLYRRVVSAKEGEHVPKDSLDLAWLVGLSNADAIPDELTVDGRWRSKDNLDVSVDSVLAPGPLAESLAFTVLTFEPFDQGFPLERDLSSDHAFQIPIERFLREPEDRERKIDGHDPYASTAVLRYPGVTDQTKTILGLQAADNFGRDWRDKHGIQVIRGETWGVENQDNRENGSRNGHRVQMRVDSLLKLLSLAKKELVLLVRVQKYLRDEATIVTRRHKRAKRFMPFHIQTLVAIVSPDGGIRFIRRIPKYVRQAVRKLPDREKHEFGARLQAIASSRPVG